MEKEKVGSVAGNLGWKIAKSLIRISIAVVVITILLSLFGVFPAWETLSATVGRVTAKSYVHDRAGVLSSYDKGKFNEYLDWIFKESDVDMHFVFVRGTGSKTLEELAVQEVKSLGIGRKNREERGVLLLYDLGGKRMRIEVGYGLESYFPDAFISYLMDEHAEAFFASGDVTVGLRLMLRLLHHRVREAVLGGSFDPTVIEIVRARRHLSGGAGASMPMAIGARGDAYLKDSLPAEERKRYYSPQATPQEVYEKYIEWLAAGKYDPGIGIFTEPSQQYMARLPMSKAYFEYLLLQEYGRQYKIDERGELALLYFTDDPLVSPHFFVRDKDGWRMDIMAELGNTINRVGGVYAWDYHINEDVYTMGFKDMFVGIRGYIRIKDGDNRQLPVREDVQRSLKHKAFNFPNTIRTKLSSASAKLATLAAYVRDKRNKHKEESSETEGWTELHFAAANGELSNVRRLVKECPVDVKNSRGRTPLYEAAKRGRLDVVRFLVDSGADVNSKGTVVGFTPLHIASEQKHIDVITLLLISGAEVNIQNGWGQTPLWQASWQPWHGNSEVAKVLYENGADLNQKDKDGFAPLHMAARAGHIPFMIFLLEHGVDINVRTNKGSTPLILAANDNRLAAVETLLQYGADRDIMIGRSTARDIAMKKGHEEVARLLSRHSR